MFTRRSWVLPLSLVALLGLVIGCSGKDADDGDAVARADSPDEAVVAMARGLANGRPEVLWYGLPASYQQDVTDLVHEAADKMDPQVWNKSFAVLGKLTRLLEDKRELILEHPMMASKMESSSDGEAGWNALVGISQTLVNSELSDLDRMKKLDVEHFLASTGGSIMKQIAAASKLSGKDDWAESMDKLRKIEAEVVDESGDQATVEIRTPGEPNKREKFVRVEGRWVPAEMAKDWTKEIADARRRIADYSGQDEQTKQSTLMQLSMAEGVIDSMLAANTADEFNVALGAVMGMAMGSMMAQGSSAPSAPAMTIQQTEQPRPGPAAQPVLVTENTPPRALLPPGMRGNDESVAQPKRSGVALHDAGDHIGEVLRVVGPNSVSFKSRLIAVDDDVLTFERDLAAGSISFELERSQIESLSTVR